MARYQLIDDYLVDIERRIRWRPDHAAAADELRDHLYSAVDDLLDEEEPTDADRWQAQQQVIARFGDPGTVATTFATTGSRGLAVPTTFTTSAGRLGVGSAGGWLAACGLFAASDLVDRATGDWDGAPQILFAIGTSVLLLTAALTTVVVAGLIRRHGGLGVVGWAAVVLAGLGAVASLLSWFVFGWVTLLGLGALTLSLAMARRSLAPRTATILFGTDGLAGGRRRLGRAPAGRVRSPRRVGRLSRCRAGRPRHRHRRLRRRPVRPGTVVGGRGTNHHHGDRSQRSRVTIRRPPAGFGRSQRPRRCGMLRTRSRGGTGPRSRARCAAGAAG